MNMPESPNCPCASALPYQMCRARYHAGALPEDAAVLMRSRYSAFAKHLADYIIKTTHPEKAKRNPSLVKWKQELLQFSRDTQFVGLRILDFVDGEKAATVTFTAYLMQHGRDVSFTEKSTFAKVGKRWLYKSGDLRKVLP